MERYQPFSGGRVELFVRRLRVHWWLAVPIAFAALEVSLYFPLRPTRTFRSDAAVFLLGGDLLAAGYAPYLHLWDVKPPLIYDTTALLAVIAPGDPWTQLYLGIAITMVAAVTVVGFAGALAYHVTGSSWAAFVTAATIVGYRSFVMTSAFGIFPKYFTLAFGLAGLWASLNDRSVLAAALATAAAGYWQWGVIFVILVYGRAWRRDRLADWRRMVLASALVTVVTVAPIVLAGAGVPMITEVVFDIFRLGDHNQTFANRVNKFIRFSGLIWPLILAGVVGAFETVYRERDYYWIAAAVAWPVVQIGFVDFDSTPDLFLLLVFAAIALGVTVGTLRLSRHQQIAVVCVVFMLSGGQLYDHRQAIQTPSESTAVTADAQSVKGAFLDQRLPPANCTISMGSKMERLYADQPNDHYCGTEIPIG